MPNVDTLTLYMIKARGVAYFITAAREVDHPIIEIAREGLLIIIMK